MPPEVGYAETSSDIVKPMIRMKTPRIGHDHEIEIGPPLLKPAPKFVKQPARIEMIENEIAKLEKPDQDRVEVLLVAELGETAFVVAHLRQFSHQRPPEKEVRPRSRTSRCTRDTAVVYTCRGVARSRTAVLPDDGWPLGRGRTLLQDGDSV